jgi:UDP-3-O-[3-hydroxymyristoyl] N-acetylglucosamine deacetylase
MSHLLAKPLPPGGAASFISGRGFHTGRPNRLRLSPWDPGRGVARIGGIEHLVWGLGVSKLDTGLRCTQVDGIGPLEHISAAAVILGVRGWVLDAEHSDLPLFDGSAAPWAEGFLAFPLEKPKAIPLHLASRTWTGADRGVVAVEPNDGFHLDVEWSGGPFGAERWEGGIADLAGVLGARTFADADAWWEARRKGLLGGVDVGSGRLFRGNGPVASEAMAELRREGLSLDGPVWSGGRERMPMECAAHKALDLVGDIGCAIGYLPALRITARDAGHALHAMLCRALRAAHGTKEE